MTVRVWKRNCHKPEGGGSIFFSAKFRSDGKCLEFIIIKNRARSLRCSITENVLFCVSCGGWSLSLSTADLQKLLSSEAGECNSLLYPGDAMRDVMKSKKWSHGTGQLCFLSGPLGASCCAERTSAEKQLSPHQVVPQTENMYSHFRDLTATEESSRAALSNVEKMELDVRNLQQEVELLNKQKNSLHGDIVLVQNDLQGKDQPLVLKGNKTF